MWIYTTDGALINLDCYERVAYDERAGTTIYKTIDYTKRLAQTISKYDVVDEIALALREGKNFLEV